MTDATGAASLALSIPDDPRIVGAHLYSAVFGTRGGALLAGNAMEVAVCGR